MTLIISPSPETRDMCDSRFLRLCSEKRLTYLIGSHHRPIRIKIFKDCVQIAEKTSDLTSQYSAIREITENFIPFLEKLKN